MRPSTPEAPAALSPPPPLRLLPGGAIQFPGGVFLLAVDQRLFTAHCNCDVTPTITRQPLTPQNCNPLHIPNRPKA